jgi:heterotetrameric sarcosine oxidase gamma subunit
MEEVRSASMVRLHSLHELPFPGPVPISLPTETGACSGDDPAALCLRPGEWLLISETIPAQALLQQFGKLIDSEQTSALDSSDGLAVFRLSGPAAPWLLSKLSCLDFLAGKNHGQHCAQTKMGHVAVIVHYHQLHGDEFVFDLIFDRSIAKYLWLLLITSADHADELTICHGDVT